MKRAVLVAVTFSVMVLSVSLPDAARADGKLDQILSNMQRAAKSITRLSAKLHQDKLRKALGPPPEAYDGTIWFRHDQKRKDSIRINYVTPKDELIQAITVVGDDITIYQHRAKQVIKTTRQKAAGKSDEFNFIASPYQSIPELKGRFDIAYNRDENLGSTSTVVLELTPKGKSAANKVTLWVNQKDWFPIKYQVIEKNGDVSTFVLSDIKLGGAIPDGMFKLTWPSGTKVLEQ